MRVGHGVAFLPVPPGSTLGGYVDRTGPSDGVADALETHVITVTDGTRRFALVVLDVVCVNADLAAAIASAVEADHVWVCATHTHSGPETGCQPRGATTPSPWVSVCTAAAVQATRDAVRAEVPGTLSAGVSSVSSVASVRSRPSGALAVPVDVVSFHTAAGLGGLLVVLPVHPTVLPATSTAVSADLTGSVRRALGTRAPWVVVATGAAGDISTRGVRQGADPAECARLGQVVASQLTVPAPGPPDGTVWAAEASLTVTPAGDRPPSTPENCRCSRLELNQGSLDQNCQCEPITSNRSPDLSPESPQADPSDVRNRSHILSPESPQAGPPDPPEPLSQARSASGQGHCRCSGLELDQGSLDRFCRCQLTSSNRSPALSRQEETLRQAERLAVRSAEPLGATVRAARLGGVDLIGLPGEPFLDLRPESAILLGYVGGYLGYLPTREACAGEPTYETVISPVAPGEPERLVDTALGLLQNEAS